MKVVSPGRLAARHPRIAGATILVLVVAGWQVLFGVVVTGSSVVATPAQIIDTIAGNADALRAHLTATIQEAALGFAFGTSVAVALALVCLSSDLVETNIMRIAVVVNSLPLIVLAPVLVIWFGATLTPRVIVAALATFFGVLVNTTRGLQSVRRESEELFHVLGAGPLQRLVALRLPSSLPFFLSSLRVAVVASVLGAVIGEWVGANQGLGVLLIFSLYQLDTPMLWAAMTLLTATALAGYLLVALLERFAIPWHSSVRPGRVESRTGGRTS